LKLVNLSAVVGVILKECSEQQRGQYELDIGARISRGEDGEQGDRMVL
jgi:hypothetical protein